MADFPKHYTHVNSKLPNRVANTPADAVNLEARGYKLVEVAEDVKVETGQNADLAEAARAAKAAEASEAAKAKANANKPN